MEPSISTSHLASPGKYEGIAAIQDLETTYMMTFDQPPQGPQCKDASWLEAQILGAQHGAMEARADTGKRVEQLITDERLAKTLANNDARARARSTRSAKRQANVIATNDGEILRDLQQQQRGNQHGGCLALSNKGLSKQLRNSGRHQESAQHPRRSGQVDMEEIAVTDNELQAHSAAASADRLHRRPGTLHSSSSIVPVKESSVRSVAASDPAPVGKVGSKTPRVVPSSGGSKRARRNSEGHTGSCATEPKAARTASFDGKLGASDMTPCQEAGVDASSSVSRLHYVPQHQLKLLFNQILAEYISTATYTNISIAMSETDKFLTCIYIEAELLQHSYNAISYIDFILHHFEHGHLLQTCADRRSTFADKIRANDRFITHVVPPRYISCFMKIPCDVTFKCATSRIDIADYIVQHTNVEILTRWRSQSRPLCSMGVFCMTSILWL
jgi:hypothetical protein